MIILRILSQTFICVNLYHLHKQVLLFKVWGQDVLRNALEYNDIRLRKSQ